MLSGQSVLVDRVWVVLVFILPLHDAKEALRQDDNSRSWDVVLLDKFADDAFTFTTRGQCELCLAGDDNPGYSLRVDVSGVESIDAQLIGLFHQWKRLFFICNV